MDNLFLPINIETISDGSIQSFDVFFKSPDGRMVIYCSSGAAINEEQKKIVYDNKIEKLYIAKKDKNIYSLYIEEMLPDILSDPAINVPVKASITYESVAGIAKSVFETPQNENLQRYKKTINDAVKFVFDEHEALQRLIALTTFDFSIYNHCLNVGLFGIGLAKELLGQEDGHDFQEIAAGFFLH